MWGGRTTVLPHSEASRAGHADRSRPDPEPRSGPGRPDRVGLAGLSARHESERECGAAPVRLGPRGPRRLAARTGRAGFFARSHRRPAEGLSGRQTHPDRGGRSCCPEELGSPLDGLFCPHEQPFGRDTGDDASGAGTRTRLGPQRIRFGFRRHNEASRLQARDPSSMKRLPQSLPSEVRDRALRITHNTEVSAWSTNRKPSG